MSTQCFMTTEKWYLKIRISDKTKTVIQETKRIKLYFQLFWQLWASYFLVAAFSQTWVVGVSLNWGSLSYKHMLYPTWFSHLPLCPAPWDWLNPFTYFKKSIGFHQSIRYAICYAITMFVVVQWILQGQSFRAIFQQLTRLANSISEF